MIQKQDKNALRKTRHLRVRNKVSGSSERPRLNVYRSTNHIYAQVIDDVAGCTLVSASTMETELREKAGKMNKRDAARLVGAVVAEKALAAGISRVVFDRGGYLYTGRVADLAAAAREKGLQF